MPILHGGRLSRQRVGQIVGEAAKQASERLDRPPRQQLRRQVVMGQIGHADSKMTMDVYAQLEQRVDRRHGASFDRLVRRAREQVADIGAPA